MAKWLTSAAVVILGLGIVIALSLFWQHILNSHDLATVMSFVTGLLCGLGITVGVDITWSHFRDRERGISRKSS